MNTKSSVSQMISSIITGTVSSKVNTSKHKTARVARSAVLAVVLFLRSHKNRTGASWVLSRVMRKLNSVTYEVGKAKAEQAAGMFGLAAGQRAASCPSRVAHVRVKLINI